MALDTLDESFLDARHHGEDCGRALGEGKATSRLAHLRPDEADQKDVTATVLEKLEAAGALYVAGLNMSEFPAGVATMTPSSASIPEPTVNRFASRTT